MSASPAWSVIPDAHLRATLQALTTAFPGETMQTISPVHGGLSGSLVFRVQLREHTVLLRIIQNQSVLNNPERQFACMRAAAGSGVAPCVYYTDVASGVSISAFVETDLAPHTPRDVAQFGTLLQQLHSGPAFPEFLTCFGLIRGGLAQLQQVGANIPRMTQAVLQEFELVAQLLEPQMVLAPSHNDLNPGNVLRDGERQWLVDWESACMNDPLFDVACAIQWFLLDAEQVSTLLTAYFSRLPNEAELAKLTLMQLVMYCYYMLVFQLISLGPDGLGDMDAVNIHALPTFADALGAVRRGEWSLQDPLARRQLSLVIAKQAQALMQLPDYAKAKLAM